MKRTFVVDRLEGKTCVLIDDSGNVSNVSPRDLPKDCCAEGAVLYVPVDGQGSPQWRQALRAPKEEEKRRREASIRLRRLQKTDPGGDITL